jgi:HlyD family secretion protein
MSIPAEPPGNRERRLLPFPTKVQPQPSSRLTMIFWIAAGWVALLLIGVAAVWLSFGSGNAVQYATASVTRGPIVRTVTATGTVNPELTIIVGSYVSGVIQEVSCDYNTEVRQGQICATIDPRPYQTVVDQNKANLVVARAQLLKDQASLAYAKVTYERNAQLAVSKAVSQDTVDNAKSAYDQAQAQIAFDQATIQQHQAQLDAAQVNLDYTNIVSPVKGTVVSRNVTRGQTVAASFQTPTLFLIATDLTLMQVDTNVSESDVGEIRVGDKATFAVDAYPKRTFEGAVTQVRQSPQNVQNVVTYDIVIGVANPDLALMPGMTAATRIITDERKDVVRVPVQALHYVPAHGVQETPAQIDEMQRSSSGIDEGGHGRVWVLEGGRAAPVAVTVGLDDDNFAEIVEGTIKPGDTIIVGEQRRTTQSAVPMPRF